jgi:hypothetical protein
MSHFTVLVVGENYREQLAPYHEFECTGANDQYIQNVDVTEKVLASLAEENINFLADDQDRVERYEEMNDVIPMSQELYAALDYHGLLDSLVTDEQTALDVISQGQAHGNPGWPDDECQEFQYKWGYAVVTDGKLVKAVNRTNPNAKWDWYTLGGRWTGFFNVKPGADGTQGSPGLLTAAPPPGTADQLLLRDMDVEGMMEARAKEAEETWDRCEEDNFPKHFAGIGEDETKEDFIARRRKRFLCTFAVVKDSKWYQRGEMGWWGVVTDEKDNWEDQFAQLIADLPGDTLLSLVDCHI